VKKIFQIFLLFLIFFFFSSPTTVRAEQVCTVSIVSPSGGETFTEGQTMNIIWNASSNVDKVAIMYKTDQHHGNWVVFSTDNTGSYSWNIDVGNTTNTQFYLEITAYETGKGSCSAFTNYFTINQKPDAPSAPGPVVTSPNPTNSSLPSLSPFLPTKPASNSQSYARTLTPTPTPSPIPRLSLSRVTLASWFYFEGSQTTDLKAIADPTKVENFTLDTIQGWTFVWRETLNLSDPKRIKALQGLENYWVVEEWFFWMKVEWWEIFREPVEVTFRNESLTGCQPQLVVSEVKEGGKPEAVFTVKETKPGEVKAIMTGTARVEILPKVELFGDKEVRTSKPIYILEGRSSHKNLVYKIKTNGQEKEIVLDDFNPNGGNFKIKVDSLVKGANFAQLWYRLDDRDYQLAGEKTIYYQPNYLFKFLLGLGLVVLAISLTAIGVILEKKLFLSQKLKKFFTRNRK